MEFDKLYCKCGETLRADTDPQEPHSKLTPGYVFNIYFVSDK